MDYLKSFCKKFDTHLQILSKQKDFPSKLLQSISYINNSGGKRIRPFTVCETAKLFGVDFKTSVYAAAAIEMVHNYSLIHDDLPAMDDDDFRRGRLTLHKKYDEALAILTGDVLLTESFAVLTNSYGKKNPKMCIELISNLSNAAGGVGLVGGQTLDLFPTRNNLNSVKKMQYMKTGKLFACSSIFGAILGNADKKDFNNMCIIGDRFGRAFQIVDDLLDISGDAKILGKKTRKDFKQGKLTLVDIKGMDKATKIAEEYIFEAKEILLGYGKSSEKLISMSNYIINRSL